MTHLHATEAVHEVLQSELERQLAAIRASVAEPVAGIFGPDSLMWHVNREAAIFLGAGRALLLQLAHPWIATAIFEHSRTLSDPIGRFHRTFNVVFTMVFGSLDQALAAARLLHCRHTAVRGVVPEALGRFRAGSAYCANEISALRWVFATLVDSALEAHDLVLPPATHQDRERYYAESRAFAALFGISDTCLPSDWQAFRHYANSMLESDTLAVGPAARHIAGALFDGIRLPPSLFAWYRAITAGMLPANLREEFGFAYAEAERRRARRALAWLRRIYPALPGALRYVGPYHEARARLAGRARPGPLVRLLNRIWTGQVRMTGGETPPPAS